MTEFFSVKYFPFSNTFSLLMKDLASHVALKVREKTEKRPFSANFTPFADVKFLKTREMF